MPFGTLAVFVQVHRVFPSGLAAQEGTIEKGDEVLSINGQTLRGLTHADATAALRQSRCLKQAVVVVSKGAEDDGGEAGGPAGQSQLRFLTSTVGGVLPVGLYRTCVLCSSGGAGSPADCAAPQRSWRSRLHPGGRKRLNPWRQTFSHQQGL